MHIYTRACMYAHYPEKYMRIPHFDLLKQVHTVSV